MTLCKCDKVSIKLYLQSGMPMAVIKQQSKQKSQWMLVRSITHESIFAYCTFE